MPKIFGNILRKQLGQDFKDQSTIEEKGLFHFSHAKINVLIKLKPIRCHVVIERKYLI